MRFPGCEFGFENSQSGTAKPAALSAASKTGKSKRRANTDPDRVWQIFALFVIAVVLTVAGVL